MLHEQFTSDLFIQRTKKILEQYRRNCSTIQNECYDVTLSINCLYGLLMMASKKNHDSLSKKNAKKYLTEYGITSDEIKYECTLKSDSSNIDITFEELIRGIRNGLAHWEENNSSYKSMVEFILNDNKFVEKIKILGQIIRRKTASEPKKEIIIGVELNVSDTSENSIMKIIALI